MGSKKKLFAAEIYNSCLFVKLTGFQMGSENQTQMPKNQTDIHLVSDQVMISIWKWEIKWAIQGQR